MQRLTGNAETRKSKPLMAPGSTRKLRVAIDAELLGRATSADDDPLGLLVGLLRHESIEYVRYSDDGPPSTARRTDFGTVPGWLTAEPVDPPDARLSHLVTYHYEGAPRGGESGIVGGVAMTVGWHDSHDDSYAHLSPDEGKRRRRLDTVAGATARTAHADVYITDRPYLHTKWWTWHRDLNICRSSEALELIGFFLRSRGHYISWADPRSGPVRISNQSMFNWIASRALLPAGWRWFSHCVAADKGAPLGDLSHLGGSVFHRLGRYLIARDAIYRAASLPQTNSLADEAMYSMDVALVFLQGAFDAVARVAHRSLSIPKSERGASWRRDGWRRELDRTCSELFDLTSDETPGGDLLDLLGILRNTIHGAGLESVGFSRALSSEPLETLVRLPPGEVDRVRQILQRQGWEENWGLEDMGAAMLHARPDSVIDSFLRPAGALLDRMMAATPVENLTPGVVVAVPSPSHDPYFTLAVRHQQSALWQYGLA